MIRKAAAALTLAGLSACAPPPESDSAKAGQPPAAAATEVAPPTPSDIAVSIGAAQAGQVVDVPIGRRFAIQLVGVPTAGYLWAPARMPAFVTRAGESSGPTTAAQSQPGFTGGNHWEVLMFVATAPGEGEIVVEQRRPWETNEAPVDSFSVTVRAR